MSDTFDPKPGPAKSEYRVLGHSLPKPDACDKALGRTQYCLEPLPPGTLIGKLVRSPHPHARILRIDASAAQRLPGVRVVVTGTDLPEVRFGGWVKARTLLARDVVRHVGEPVAAIAAEDEETAEEARELVRVEYEPLRAVFDPLEAMEPRAPLLHARQEQYEPRPPKRQAWGNVLNHAVLQRGDLPSAWTQAEFAWEGVYSTPAQYHVTLETHEAVSIPDGQGGVALWIADKAPFLVQRNVASALELPLSHVRVTATAMGADFGGRGKVSFEPICALMALRAGRPVHVCFSREEEFLGTFPKVPSRIELKAGAKRDGSLVILEGRLIYDVGAYCMVIATLESSLEHLAGPYRVPNFRFEGYGVYTNNPPKGHVRAPTSAQPTFAIESHLDLLARELGLDPVDVRLRNALQDGDPLPGGGIVTNVGVAPTLRKVRDYVCEHAGERHANRGWGVACAQDLLYRMKEVMSWGASAQVRINEDGTAALVTGVADQGAGQHTVLAQIVAEVLGVPFASVRVVAANTDLPVTDEGTSGSRSTMRTGQVAKLAAEDARRQLLALASRRLEVPAEELDVADGRIFPRHAPGAGVSLATIAGTAIAFQGSPIVGSSDRLRRQYQASLAGQEEVVDAPPFGTHAAHVQVDMETGQITVLDYFAAHDVGYALNPMGAEGQVQGGVTMGLGHALTEDVVIQEGRILNANLLDYRVPNAPSVPTIHCSLVQEPADCSPFGVKGVGEPPSSAVGAAIANAVHDAIGVRITDLPITAEKVLRALKAKREQDARHRW